MACKIDFNNFFMKTFNTIQAHPFHLVEPSPWPLASSFSLLLLTSAAVMNFHGSTYGSILLTLGFICVLTSMALWWRDCVRESTYQGFHTSIVQRGISIGFILFVISEIFFFFQSSGLSLVVLLVLLLNLVLCGHLKESFLSILLKFLYLIL